MRLYYSGASPDNLRKAREHAPSHAHGAMWTPQKMTRSGLASQTPYALDNGAYSHKFDGELWATTLDQALTEMPHDPDFVVLPDVPGDAVATIEKHTYWLRDAPLPLDAGELMRYWVIQPGLPIKSQFEAMDDLGSRRLPPVEGVFVGGSKRWVRAHAEMIVREAHERGLLAHVGNPSGKDGLVWAYRTGFDSADTTTVFQNQYWHYLDRLEAATEETGDRPGPDAVEQTSLGGNWGGA